MIILALDSTTGTCSVALADDGRVLASRSAAAERGQAEILMPMVEAVMAEAGLRFTDVARFAVTVGPGSFTGLRIGLAAARGMALASGRPLIGVTTFEAFAHGIPTAERAGRHLLVAVDSRRAEPYVQVFGPDLAPLTGPLAMPPGSLPEGLPGGILPPGPLLVTGDAAALVAPALRDRAETTVAAAAAPDAAAIARLAAGRPVPEAPPGPLYLRAPDVTLPGGRPR